MSESDFSATTSGPAEAVVLHGLGISAFQRGNVETALKFIASACAHPEAPALWHRNHAEILDRCGDSEGAEAAVRLALSRDPENAAAWDTLGTILVRRDKHAESCACYEKAVEIDPEFVQALNNLAVTLSHLGQYQAAKAQYERVLRLVPDSTEILLNYATLLGEQGDYQQGLKLALKVLYRSPKSKRAQSFAAECRHKLKRSTKPVRKRSAAAQNKMAMSA